MTININQVKDWAFSIALLFTFLKFFGSYVNYIQKNTINNEQQLEFNEKQLDINEQQQKQLGNLNTEVKILNVKVENLEKLND